MVLRGLRGMCPIHHCHISAIPLSIHDAICLYTCIVKIEEQHQVRDSSGSRHKKIAPVLRVIRLVIVNAPPHQVTPATSPPLGHLGRQPTHPFLGSPGHSKGPIFCSRLQGQAADEFCPLYGVGDCECQHLSSRLGRCFICSPGR
jgi:hypothetical protein